MLLSIPKALLFLSVEEQLRAVQQAAYSELSSQARALTAVIFHAPKTIRADLTIQLWNEWGTLPPDPGYDPFPCDPLPQELTRSFEQYVDLAVQMIGEAKAGRKGVDLRFYHYFADEEDEYAAAIVYMFLRAGFLHGKPVQIESCSA